MDWRELAANGKCLRSQESGIPSVNQGMRPSALCQGTFGSTLDLIGLVDSPVDERQTAFVRTCRHLRGVRLRERRSEWGDYSQLEVCAAGGEEVRDPLHIQSCRGAGCAVIRVKPFEDNCRRETHLDLHASGIEKLVVVPENYVDPWVLTTVAPISLAENMRQELVGASTQPYRIPLVTDNVPECVHCP
ncbi:hypothetical protein SprV_0200660000 [Sparganum proliferum]